MNAVDSIPIENIYYLLCYAWNRLDEGALVDVQSLRENNLPNLFARVLITGVNRLLRDGFDRGYVDASEDLPGIRGKVDFEESLRRHLFFHARAHCVFDEFTHDILHNQILKATLVNLRDADGLDAELHTRMSWLVRRMRDIGDIALTHACFRRVNLHRNNRFYRFLMNICELVHDSLLVDEHTGRHRFRDFLRDEARMWRLFQDFVLNFFRLEQHQYTVQAQVFYWHAQAVGNTSLDFLPRLETDITLRAPNRTLIVDTKFSAQALSTRYDKMKVKRGDLFQLFAYLRNCSPEEKNETVAGLLLYPAVEQDVDLAYTLHGHPVRVYAVNLDQPWPRIRQDLLSLLISAEPQYAVALRGGLRSNQGSLTTWGKQSNASAA